MKKFISLLLVVLMVFSTSAIMSVQAEDVVSTTAVASEEDFNYEDIPLWVVELALKLVKIFAKVAVKLGKFGLKTGLIDFDDIMGTLSGIIDKGNATVTETQAA